MLKLFSKLVASLALPERLACELTFLIFKEALPLEVLAIPKIWLLLWVKLTLEVALVEVPSLRLLAWVKLWLEAVELTLEPTFDLTSDFVAEAVSVVEFWFSALELVSDWFAWSDSLVVVDVVSLLSFSCLVSLVTVLLSSDSFVSLDTVLVSSDFTVEPTTADSLSAVCSAAWTVLFGINAIPAAPAPNTAPRPAISRKVLLSPFSFKASGSTNLSFFLWSLIYLNCFFFLSLFCFLIFVTFWKYH